MAADGGHLHRCAALLPRLTGHPGRVQGAGPAGRRSGWIHDLWTDSALVDNSGLRGSGRSARVGPRRHDRRMTTTRAPAPLAALLDLLLPRTCGGCGAGPAGSGGWCPACAEDTAGPVAVRVPGAGRVVVAGRYRGPLRRAVLEYKERGRRDLAPDLAALLVPVVAAALPVGPPVGTGRHSPGPGREWSAVPRADPDLVRLVPAPSRPGAARARGGDHVLRLCRSLEARLPGLGLSARTLPVLGLDRRARDSVGLDAAGRAANLAAALRTTGPGRRAGDRWAGTGRRGRPGPRNPAPTLTEPPPSSSRWEPVLLVDDVVTTGATLRACRDALARVGLEPVGSVLLADATTGGRL